GELLADLAEMERVGSTPGVVEILAQVDRSPGHDASKGNWHGTRRYYVTRGEDPRRIHSRLLADLGPTNTGDPRVLESFIRFGVERYPAERTALILMNHGSGFYVPPEMLSGGTEKREGRGVVPAQPRRRRRGPLFHSTAERLVERPPISRGIAYDDTSADCLDNQELTRVLATAHRFFGRKVDVVGMDACLMTMLEVAYQLRDHAQVLVGSEELEPGPGWPHAAILGDLTKNPTMTPAELGATIVQRYVESYRHGAEDATQSAIDLGQLGDLVEAVDTLARALLRDFRRAHVAAALHLAWRRTLHFFEHAYVDLHHFAVELGRATDARAIRQACGAVRAAIEGRGARSPLIAEAHAGPRMAPARGLSIYFPAFRNPSVHYQGLDFARRSRWAEFLEAYLGEGR
ncbi:MAG: clostripain-related cysteine peptidase, partial [candidate division NC10 bacterium]